MEFVPYRLLRNQPSELRKKLEEQGELVVTVDGEPLAIMLQIPKGNLEDLVLLLAQVRAQLAVSSIRNQARRQGLDQMTVEQADQLVQEARSVPTQAEGWLMRIVVDTNVLVSGLLNPYGSPGRILDLVLSGRIQVLYDDRILEEYQDVLARPQLAIDLSRGAGRGELSSVSRRAHRRPPAARGHTR